MSNSTITLQSTVNFCSTHADLLPLTGIGGYTNEPALTLCNDALSDIFADPNDYKFNRAEMPMLVTCPNRQDVKFAGATVFSLGSTSQGWGIDLASNSGITVTAGVVTVKTIEAHRFAVGDVVYINGVTMSPGTASKYNSTFTDNGASSSWSGGYTIVSIPTTTSFTFTAASGQNNSDVGGAPGITDFNYATSVSFQELNNNSSPPNVTWGTVYRELPVISRVANPVKVSVLSDLGTGVLKIRFSWVPGSTTWVVNLVYQAKPPLKTALSQTWAPIPDQYQAMFNQALIYRMYRFLGKAQADNEYKKLQAEIMRVQGGDDAEPTDVQLQPDNPLMENEFFGWW